MVVTKNCFLGNVITAFKLVENISPENVAVVGLLPLPNKRTNGVEPLILAENVEFFCFAIAFSGMELNRPFFLTENPRWRESDRL
jgi:hypothetical protein